MPRARAGAAAGRAMGVGVGVDQGRQAGGERAGGRGQILPLNPHNYGSFLLYGGGELIAPVTVSSCLCLLSFSVSSLPPRRRHKTESSPSVHPSSFAFERPHLSRPLAFPVPYLCAHGVVGEQVPPEPSSSCEPCTGCATIRFLGSESVTARSTSSSSRNPSSS